MEIPPHFLVGLNLRISKESHSWSSLQCPVLDIRLLSKIICLFNRSGHSLYSQEGSKVGSVGGDDDQGKKPPDSTNYSSGCSPYINTWIQWKWKNFKSKYLGIKRSSAHMWNQLLLCVCLCFSFRYLMLWKNTINNNNNSDLKRMTDQKYYLGLRSDPCCMSVPTVNQKLLASVKSFWTTNPVSTQGCGADHSAGENLATIQIVRETIR